MRTFLGIGMGPIQTGIFVAGAAKGKFDRIVIAEIDDRLRVPVHAAGTISVNIAEADSVRTETYGPVEVYNSNDPEELKKLIEAAAEADELATALPSVNFFKFPAPWLVEGFKKQPDRVRFIYTAENNNHAAEALQEALGEKFPNTWCLNTVIGKMSGVISAEECAERGFAPLAPGADRGHLVEKFNTIYISSAPGVEDRKVADLYQKSDLLPFEEAKLYGHNAIHFWLGIHGAAAGCTLMSDLADKKELIAKAREAFVNESGAALCKKYAGLDELFTPAGFAAYADDLLVRMVNIYLQDAIARVIRDLDRKLGWDDRVIGTMRMILSQGCSPEIFAEGAALALKAWKPEADQAQAKEALAALWPAPWGNEHETLWQLIAKNL